MARQRAILLHQVSFQWIRAARPVLIVFVGELFYRELFLPQKPTQNSFCSLLFQSLSNPARRQRCSEVVPVSPSRETIELQKPSRSGTEVDFGQLVRELHLSCDTGHFRHSHTHTQTSSELERTNSLPSREGKGCLCPVGIYPPVAQRNSGDSHTTHRNRNTLSSRIVL